MARTDTLGNFLTDVADAIREKTGSSDTITASDFDTAIANIPSGIDLSEYFNSTVTYDASQSYRNIFSFIVKKIPFDITISSTTTTLSFLFQHCDSLRAVPKIICGDNVINMTSLYYGDTYLTLNEPIDTSGLNTTNVTNMASMFRGIRGLSTVNVSGFNTSKVTNMNHMFNSTQFTSLDLSSFTSTSLTSASNMFAYSTSLMHLDIRNMDLTTITTTTNMFGAAQSATRIPVNCEIIVADQTQKSWITSNYSWLRNVKTVDEYEAE